MNEELSSLAVTFGPFLGVVVTAFVTWRVAKIQTKGSPEHQLIDQLQQELESERTEREKYRTRLDTLDKRLTDLQATVSTMQVKETALLIYVSTLRNHIDAGSPPPPPDWPPGLNPFTT